ncbi:uncharacterized protein UBRO_21016 [Ustilago bromivora]|uniref:Uncharacterized protein n=1 Tax=Ustilago bromivora TaxID=307758 RepID=A0A1K0GC97_9BASI|nr:uncharacterized protein UBRO_21016 [Ustilago bromivora]
MPLLMLFLVIILTSSDNITHRHTCSFPFNMPRFTSDTLQLLHPLPASTDVLIKLVSQFHRASKPYQTVKRNLSVLKSLHINLSQPTTAFDAARLARALQGYKRVAGNPPPTAKLPITLPLLTQLVDTLPLVCLSKHNCRMFRAAFCLAFTCFLCSGKLTWENPSSHPVLTVGSVGFASDGTFTTIFLPSSKTNPFDASVTLTVPSVPH